MNPKLWARVAHVVDGKAADQRRAYYDSHFHFNHKKSGLLATPAVWMVVPFPEEGSGQGEATPLPSEESDSGESYEAVQEDTGHLPG